MNKRIKELAEQAGIDLYGDTGVEATQGNLQEFAELIVRECVDQVKDDDNAFDILKHFGVE